MFSKTEKLTYYVFYPIIAAVFVSNRPVVYTIAIYGRLYTAE